jgi:hypothetical protein
MNTNEFVTDGWRDAAANPDLVAVVLARLRQREKARHKRVLAYGFLATGTGSAALSALFLFGTPAVTLAQVIAAGSKVDSYTATNRRIMGPDKGNGFSFIKRVSGDALCQTVRHANPSKRDRSFGYIDANGSITYFAEQKIALLDSHERSTAAYKKIPEITSMLKDFKASKIDQGFEYEGRKVTRFTFKRKVHDYDIDEELLADPNTKLPIKFTSMRDNRSWGDEWIYDYTPLDRASIKPIIPAGTKIIDLVPQRKQFVEALSQSSSTIPLFLSSSAHETVLIVKKSVAKNFQFLPYSADVRSNASGKNKHFRGNEFFQDGRNEFVIGSQEFFCINLQSDADRLTNAFDASDTLSGSITIENYKANSTIQFADIPGLQVGFVDSIIEPFRKPAIRKKLGYQKK